jgi:hypothetical protein
MQRIHRLSLLPALLLLSVLASCASTGLAQPQSLDQRLAYTVGQITAVRSAAANALAAKAITADEAEKVLSMTDDAKAIADGAKAALAAGDESGAQNRLVLATSVLTALRSFLGRQS